MALTSWTLTATTLKSLCKDTETSIEDNAIIVCGCGILSAIVSEFYMMLLTLRLLVMIVKKKARLNGSPGPFYFQHVLL